MSRLLSVGLALVLVSSVQAVTLDSRPYAASATLTSDGTDFLALWTDDNRVPRAARVTPSGVLTPLNLGKGSLAVYGRGIYLVLSREAGALTGMRVRSSTGEKIDEFVI